MKIVILGSGNVAFHLAKAFSENKIGVSQIFGRNENALKEISEKCHIPYSTDEMMEADLLAARKAVLIKNADWS